MTCISAQRRPRILNHFSRAFAGVALAGLALSATAAPVQLVVNGEFETINNVAINPNSWYAVANANVPGWTGSTGSLEIWGENFQNMALGSDGLAHGRHLELAYNSDREFVTQSVTIAQDGSIDFSFDAWRRSGSGVLWSVTSNHGLNLGGTLNLADNDWHALPIWNFDVTANDVLTLRFQSVGGGSMGAHIDQVSMLFSAASAVPEPQSLALLFAGLGMMGFLQRRRKQR